MPPTFLLSSSARLQLVEIYQYSLRQWGKKQAESYLADFYDAFEKITTGSLPGRPIDPGYGVIGRCAPCGKHRIYWKFSEDGTIRIAEILHERMDVGDRLAKSANLTHHGDEQSSN